MSTVSTPLPTLNIEEALAVLENAQVLPDEFIVDSEGAQAEAAQAPEVSPRAEGH